MSWFTSLLRSDRGPRDEPRAENHFQQKALCSGFKGGRGPERTGSRRRRARKTRVLRSLRALCVCHLTYCDAAAFHEPHVRRHCKFRPRTAEPQVTTGCQVRNKSHFTRSELQWRPLQLRSRRFPFSARALALFHSKEPLRTSLVPTVPSAEAAGLFSEPTRIFQIIEPPRKLLCTHQTVQLLE